MRLKLNRTLRAALIAAITTVGFTLTQMQAVELTEIASMNELVSAASIGTATVSTSWEIQGSAVYDFNRNTNCYLGGISISKLNEALHGNGYVTVAAWIYSTSHGNSDDGHSIFGFGEQGDGIKVIDQDGKLKMTTKNVADFATSAVGIDLNQWELVAVTFHKNGNKLDVQYMLDGSYSGTVSGGYMNTADNQTFAIGSGNGRSSRELFAGSIGDLTVFTSDNWVTYGDVSNKMSSTPTALTAVDLVWKGTGEPAVWDTQTENWLRGETPSTYSSNPATTAIFGAEGDKAVSVNGTIVAKGITVQDDYTYTVADGSSLQAATLTVADGKKATFAGTGSITFTSISGAGDLVKGDSGTMALTGASSGFTGDLTVSAGTLSISQASALGSGTHTVESGAVIEVTNASMASVGNLTVAGDGTVRLVTTSRSESGNALGTVAVTNLELADNSDHTGRYYYGGSTNLSGVGHLKFAGGQLWLTSDMTHNGGVTFGTTTYTESNDFAGAAMRVNASGTFNGAVDVQGTAKLVWGESNKTLEFADTVTGSGAINLIGWNGKTGTFKISGDASGYAGTLTTNDKITLNVTSTGELRIGSGSSLVGAVTLDGALTVDGDATISGNITGAGSLTKTGEGELVLAGTANSLGNTIQAKGGTLTMTGTYAIDNISGGDLHEDFVDDHGETATSGFSRKSGSVTVYSQDGGTVDATGATFTLGGQQVTATDGVVTIDTTIDYTTLYVNSGVVDFAAHQTYAQSKDSGITGVVLKDHTIVGNVSGTVGVTLAEGATYATVSASGATTLSSISGWSNNTLQIDGSGEVTMAGQTLTGSQKLVVSGTVNTTGALTVDSADASLLVAEDATLNINGNANLSPVHGSVEIFGEVNISHELDLSKGSTAEGTVNIGSTGKLSAWGMWMHNGVAINLEEGGEFSIGHNAVKDLTIIGKEDGSISYTNATKDASYGTNNADFTITNATVTATKNVTIGNTLENVDVVVADGGSATLNTAADSVTVEDGGTFAMGTSGEVADTITIEEGGTLLVNSELDLGDQLNSSGNIVVGTAGSLTLTGISTISSIIQNSGSVSLTGLNLDTDNFTETQGTAGAHFGLDGQETTGANYFEGTSASFVQVVDGGTSTGSDLTWGERTEQVLTADGKIITVAADIDYDTFYVNADTVKVSDVTGVGHATKFIEVTGGTLDVDTTPGTPDAPEIIVTGEGTLTGDELDVTRVHIDEQAIVHVTDELVSGGVTFYAAEGSDVSITNTGRRRAYSTEMEDMLVQAGGIVKTTEEADADVTVSNILEVGEITNTQGGTLTLDGVSEAVEVKNLIIGLAENPAAAVEMLVSGSQTETTVTVTETLAAGNGTLLANLVMADDSTLLVGGVEKALHVGSTLTMGTNIALDTLTLQALDDLAIGKDFWLIDAATGRELFYMGATGENAWYDAVFSRVSADGGYTLEGDFNIVFDQETDSLGLRKFSKTPEPTTGTLSLLALAALAARRRRK